MADRKPNYTPEESQLILDYCKDAKAQGIPYQTAYIALAEKLQRPVGGISSHHKKLLKTNMENVKPLSDAERLVLKLKSLTHTTKRNAEKTQYWKEQYQNLKNDHKKLQKDYNTLQAEYEKLLDAINAAIGVVEENENEQQIS